MFTVIARFSLRDEAAAPAFDALAVELARSVRDAEPGSLSYVCHTVADAPLERMFCEVYRDREAFEAHQQMPHTKRFFGAYEEYVAELRVDLLTPLPGLSG
ncbi:antibiotic biosynthesis monooxygenase [Streptomyces sp. NPDC089919]|uniref:putative quinol monooxygenase n=1 Tax=Streptomyces sp. NPDC089919 TaxID=3155188 RepID=UPI0034208E7F